MIFVNKVNNKPSTILRLGKYQPYWWGPRRNPNFDEFSGLILDLKKNLPYAIQHFYDWINPLLSSGFAIAVVPPHDPDHTASGIKVLAQKLASNRRIDATRCLVRRKKIAKLATGGERNVHVHLDSIGCRYVKLIKSREILLLDDVTTTNNSLIACKEILLDHGARLVQALALGCTH